MSPRILCLDDNQINLRVRKIILEQMGFHVSTSSSPSECLRILGDDDAGIDLFLLDYQMPEMNGVECATAAKEIRPSLPIVLLTGYLEIPILEGLFCEVVFKGGPPGELEEAISRVLSR